MYLHCWGCAYQDAYVLGEGHPLQGVYLHSWGCAYQDACVLGRGIHYRGCTFKAGGVHTRTHVYWGGASTTGGVPSLLGVCIPGHMCTGEGHPLQGVYLHSWGCAYQDTCVLGEGHPLQGVYLHRWGCTYQDACVLGGVPSLQPVKNIYSFELKQRFVYETIFIKLKVHRYDPSGAYGKTCN